MRIWGDPLNKAAVIAAADCVRAFGWVIHVYIALEQIVEFAPLVPQIGLPVVINHIGAPDQARGSGRLQPGYAGFMDLLRTGQVWTKLSGTYRFLIFLISMTGDVEANSGGDRNKVQENWKVDDTAFIARC
ncbi:hypothetical protein BDV24DRAFT_157275 [Aspergillus arachidicola]|uniref:Amidohydrolase-related domain-containing protein n=1 Tax=Aspergillus arachidicola TaxID=656916 RepID=A0A5N6YRP9_9EURO|nr:hypothetical protein BDV24DRAFT_157275 [Aspergillus arachidicola]